MFLGIVVMGIGSCAIEDVTLIEPGDAGGGGGTDTGGAGQGGSGATGGTAGTGAGGVGGVGGTAGDGGSAGLAGAGGSGAGGTGPVGPVLRGTFVGASVAGAASGIQMRGSIVWHASIHGSGADGVTLEGWLR